MADNALFGPDGTQEPPPLPIAADPLSGLVTGVPLAWDDAAVTGPGRVVAAPPPPDVQAIRQAVDAARAAEREVRGRVSRPVPAARTPDRYGRLRAQEPFPRPPMPARTTPNRPRSGTNGLVTLLVLVAVVVLFFLLRSLVTTLSGVFH